MQYHEAEKLHLKSIEILEKTFGKNHINLATAINNLADVYRLQKRYKTAEKLILRSLNIRIKSLGKNHHLVGTSINKLGAIV